jgi:hypothetical protein
LGDSAASQRLSRKREALRIESEMELAEGFDPALNAQRLLRLQEVSTMVIVYIFQSASL